MDELVANLKDFLSTVSLRIVEVFSHLGVIKDLHDSFFCAGKILLKVNQS